MKKKKFAATTARLLCVSMASFTVLPGVAGDRDLAACASIGDDSERLTCYDALAADTVAGASQPNPEENDLAGKISDDYGSEQLDGAEKNRKLEKPVKVVVASCRKDANKKYYFYLENGQVWKQKDNDRLRYKECGFGAVIVRDGFGYKLQVDGQSRRTRVTRIR